MDNVFQDPSFLEILPEEVGTTEVVSGKNAEQQDDCQPLREINNNSFQQKLINEHHASSKTVPKYAGADIDIIQLHSGITRASSEQSEHQDWTSDNASSASSSSASSAGLEITIKTGMVSSTRRRTSSALSDTRKSAYEKRSVDLHMQRHRDSGFNEDSAIYNERFYGGNKNSS